MTDIACEFPALPALCGKKVSAAFDGGRITSNGGVMLRAEAERSFGIADRLAALIPDRRDPTRIRHLLPDILRARILAIGAGYEDADDPLAGRRMEHSLRGLMRRAMTLPSKWLSAGRRRRSSGWRASRR